MATHLTIMERIIITQAIVEEEETQEYNVSETPMGSKNEASTDGKKFLIGSLRRQKMMIVQRR